MRYAWSEDRVFFLDDEGTQCSLLRAWTDVADPDPFVVVAAGRSALRVDDLLVLVELVDALHASGDAGAVREILP